MRRWYTWKDKLPPYNKTLLFYNGEKIILDYWTPPNESNKEMIIENLKSGKWKSYGTQKLYGATHWMNFTLPKPPEKIK